MNTESSWNLLVKLSIEAQQLAQAKHLTRDQTAPTVGNQVCLLHLTSSQDPPGSQGLVSLYDPECYLIPIFKK